MVLFETETSIQSTTCFIGITMYVINKDKDFHLNKKIREMNYLNINFMSSIVLQTKIREQPS